MKFRGIGTLLKMGTVPAIIGQLTAINGLELSSETVDSTTLDSEGGYREFQGGFKDGGEVGIEGYFDAATGIGQDKVKEKFDAQSVEEFVIEFPAVTKTKWTFNGLVTGFSTGVDLDGLITFGATIKVSGKPELVVTA